MDAASPRPTRPPRRRRPHKPKQGASEPGGGPSGDARRVPAAEDEPAPGATQPGDGAADGPSFVQRVAGGVWGVAKVVASAVSGAAGALWPEPTRKRPKVDKKREKTEAEIRATTCAWQDLDPRNASDAYVAVLGDASAALDAIDPRLDRERKGREEAVRMRKAEAKTDAERTKKGAEKAAKTAWNKKEEELQKRVTVAGADEAVAKHKQQLERATAKLADAAAKLEALKKLDADEAGKPSEAKPDGAGSPSPDHPGGKRTDTKVNGATKSSERLKKAEDAVARATEAKARAETQLTDSTAKATEMRKKLESTKEAWQASATAGQEKPTRSAVDTDDPVATETEKAQMTRISRLRAFREELGNFDKVLTTRAHPFASLLQLPRSRELKDCFPSVPFRGETTRAEPHLFPTDEDQAFYHDAKERFARQGLPLLKEFAGAALGGKLVELLGAVPKRTWFSGSQIVDAARLTVEHAENLLASGMLQAVCFSLCGHLAGLAETKGARRVLASERALLRDLLGTADLYVQVLEKAYGSLDRVPEVELLEACRAVSGVLSLVEVMLAEKPDALLSESAAKGRAKDRLSELESATKHALRVAQHVALLCEASGGADGALGRKASEELATEAGKIADSCYRIHMRARLEGTVGQIREQLHMPASADDGYVTRLMEDIRRQQAWAKFAGLGKDEFARVSAMAFRIHRAAVFSRYLARIRRRLKEQRLARLVSHPRARLVVAFLERRWPRWRDRKRWLEYRAAPWPDVDPVKIDERGVEFDVLFAARGGHSTVSPNLPEAEWKDLRLKLEVSGKGASRSFQIVPIEPIAELEVHVFAFSVDSGEKRAQRRNTGRRVSRARSRLAAALRPRIWIGCFGRARVVLRVDIWETVKAVAPLAPVSVLGPLSAEEASRSTELQFVSCLEEWLAALDQSITGEMPPEYLLKALFPDWKLPDDTPIPGVAASGLESLPDDDEEAALSLPRGRILVRAQVHRLIESLNIKSKVLDIFSGRQKLQFRKKVRDRTFEGRLNKQERVFYVELEPGVFLITSIKLDHKGFNRVIDRAAEIRDAIDRLGPNFLASDDRDATAAELDADGLRHDRLLAVAMRDTALAFKREASANPELGDGFFLPRRFLGNLDMLIETDLGTGRSRPVLTRQELEAIKLARSQQVALFLKGSAGNGKTTVLSEIARATPGARIIVPTPRLREKISRTYHVDAVTVQDRIDLLWPSEWRKPVTQCEFEKAARRRDRKATPAKLQRMWANRLDAGEVNWYRHWKKTEGLKDEEDLWEHLKGIWEGYRTGLGDPAHMEALRKHFGPLLIDEAQSITPVQLKILALSSGHPESVVIGLDSKQSVGKETAARRRGVRPAVVEACDVAGVALQHSSIVLSINFRCPIGVLKVVDSVLQRWLKRHFKAEFDDFSVDKVVRSSLWESPPVLVCPDAEAAKKLLKLSQQNFFLLHGPGAPDPVLVDDPEIKPLLVLGLEDCRGLEFDTLCVLDQPFLGTDAKLIRKLDNGEDLAEAERDRCRDGFTTWLVLMTRCRNAAVVWIQDPHHPTIEWLQKEGGLVLQVLTDGQLAQAVSLLGKARRDELNSEVAVPEGPGPNKGPSAPSNREALGAIKALAAAMEIIGVRIDDRKDFRDLAASACELVRRASGGREPIDLELGLAALPAVLDRLWAGLPPLMDEQQHGLALTFFGPVVLRELERMRERRGWELDEKIAKGWDKVQKELRDMGYAV